MTYPMDLLRQWLDEEKLKGAQNVTDRVYHETTALYAMTEINQDRPKLLEQS